MFFSSIGGPPVTSEGAEMTRLTPDWHSGQVSSGAALIFWRHSNPFMQ